MRAGSPAIDGGSVFLTSSKTLAEIDLFTGKTIRERKCKCNMLVPSRPLLTDKRIFVGTAESGLVAFDRETFDEVWRADVGNALVVTGSYVYAPSKTVGTSPFLIGSSTIGAASSDGCIHFWDVETGAKKYCIETGAPYFNAPLILDDMIYAADFAGMVRAIPNRA
jgi:outer membrane protein assembly factor BamB